MRAGARAPVLIALLLDRDDERPFVRAHHQQAPAVEQPDLADYVAAAQVAAAKHLAAVLGPRSAAQDLTGVRGPSAIAQNLSTVLSRHGKPTAARRLARGVAAANHLPAVVGPR